LSLLLTTKATTGKKNTIFLHFCLFWHEVQQEYKVFYFTR